MGNQKSKQQKALEQCKIFRQNFYQKMSSQFKKYQFEILKIQHKVKEQIINMTAIQIADILDKRKITCKQVILIFMERCCTIGVQKKYFIEQMFDEALIQAELIDQDRKKNEKKNCWREGLNPQQCFPPFYGVPCSLKQSILLKNRQSYGGFISKINPIPKQNSAYIQLIYKMGLVPIVRSNVPQSCLTICTNNNIFGYSENFHKQGRSVGGSSGGDGGAVGAKCVPIGIGSDIGGSLRIPAQFNGLYTIKPSRRNDRQSNMMYSEYLGGTPVFGQLGPLVHSTQDLKYYCQYMFNEKNYRTIKPTKIDPHLRLTDFNYLIFNERPKQKICIVKQLKELKCSKSHQRVLEEVKHILQEQGHQVQYKQLCNLDVLYYFFLRFLFSNKGLRLFNQIRKNQPLIKQYKFLYFLSNLSWLFRSILIKLLFKKQPRIARLIKQLTPLSRQDYAKDIFKNQLKVGKQVLNFFVQNKFDAILMPGFATPAPKLGQMINLQCCYLFNSCWNVLHYPAGSMPISWVKKQQTTFNDSYQDFVTKAMRNSIQGSQGLPVGIQIICLPKNQERILYIMEQIEKGLSKNNVKFGY